MPGMRDKVEAALLAPGNPSLILLWSALAVLILAVDFFSGPHVQFPIAYLVPIALAAWYNGRATPLFLAVSMSMTRYGFALNWQVHGEAEAFANLVIRVFVFCLFALLIDLVARQNRALKQEVSTLRGILPICSLCKKIRADDTHWEQLEQYITDHSGAQFTHSLCPECVTKQYAELEADHRHLRRRKDDTL